MRIVSIRELENCFDGSFIKEALLDTEVTLPFIRHLETLGELRYYPSFARPFYQLRLPGGATIKGVEGNRTMRLILNRSCIDHAQRLCIDAVDSFSTTHNTGGFCGSETEGNVQQG
jgi:hypothetical protein